MLTLLAAAGLDLRLKARIDGVRMPHLGESTTRPFADDARIAADPDYGRIVCHCERVTRGEIRDACASAVAPTDLDGLRRRTRAVMGRCQGFACLADVTCSRSRQLTVLMGRNDRFGRAAPSEASA